MDQNKKPTHTHSMMSKKLAEALIEAGVQHFSAGGGIRDVHGNQPSSQNFAPGTPVTGDMQGNFQGVGFANSTNPNSWFNGSHNSQTTSVNGVQPTQTFGQGTADQLGLSGWGRDAATQMDRLQGMNTYNAQAPGITQQSFMPQIVGAQQAQGNVYQNQNMLASQLLAQSRGQGPNPAQSMLNQQTGQNAQMQGSLMASQRGANANPALMARQAAMQGANLQQQATGQAATMQAQQQLAAQSGLAGLYQQQAQNALGAEQIQQQALANQNNAINTGSLGAQNINANASGQNAQRVGNMQSSFTDSLGGIFGMMAEGGLVPDLTKMPELIPYQNFASEDKGGKKGEKKGGGMMPSFNQGGFASYLAGGHVPGQANVQGDSVKNDVVPALLSPGEIVLPRTVVQGGEERVVEFLRHLRTKKGYGGVVETRKMNKGGKC